MGAPCWNRAGERRTCWTKAAGENLYGNCFDAPGLDQSCWLAIRRSLAVAVRGDDRGLGPRRGIDAAGDSLGRDHRAVQEGNGLVRHPRTIAVVGVA